MHKMILDETIAKVRQRESEGDCPVTPAYSVEHLENALLTLAGKVEASVSERDEKLKRAYDESVPFLEVIPDRNVAGCYRTVAHNPALHPQPSWSEEVQTADTTHSRRLFFGDPGSPQPSGETREDDLAEMLSDWFERIPGFQDTGEGTIKGRYPTGFQDVEFDHIALAKDILALIRPAPVASGGQHSSGEGESDLCRVEKAITAQPGVKKCIAHGDISVRQIANAVLRVMGARPAPVAETAGEIGRNITFSPFDLETGNAVVSPQEPDGPYWTLIAQGGEAEQNKIAAEIVRRLNAPVPAQDDDKLRRAVEELEEAYRRWVVEAGESNDVLQCVGPVIAALKSTAAKEGGE